MDRHGFVTARELARLEGISIRTAQRRIKSLRKISQKTDDKGTLWGFYADLKGRKCTKGNPNFRNPDYQRELAKRPRPGKRQP